MAWIAQAAIAAYGAYQSSQAQKKAGKSQTEQYHTPYMNEYISLLAPYLMANQQNVFETRMKRWGITPIDFSPTGQDLSRISPRYAGVGKPETGGYLNQTGGTTNPFMRYFQPQEDPDSTHSMGGDRRESGGDRFGSRG